MFRTILNNESVRKISSILYYIALIIEILIVIIDKSALSNPVEGRLFQLTFLLFLLKVILTEYSPKEYIMIILFSVFGLWIDQMADRNEILRFVIFIAACKDIDVRKALKLTLWVTTVGCLILAVLSFTGVYGDLTVIKEYPGAYVGENTKTLFAFGMGNANAFHCMFFSLTLLGMYLYNDILKWWGYLVIALADIFLFMITDSKTGVVLTFLAVMGMMVTGYIQKGHGKVALYLQQFLGKLSLYSYFAGIVISLWFAAAAWRVYYVIWFNQLGDQDDDRLIVRLDRILTGRISSLTGSTNWEGSMQSWRWLPEKGHEMYFDLGFVRLFYWYGMIAAIVILIVFSCVLVYLYREKKTDELVFIALIILYTVVEAHFVSVYLARNYTLFIAGAYWVQMFSQKSNRSMNVETDGT